jgi:hypothetical protein
MNPRQSMKQALQGAKIFAQEATLGIFRIFAVLQHIQNRLIHDRHEQTFGSSCLGSLDCLCILGDLLFGFRETYGRRFRKGLPVSYADEGARSLEPRTKLPQP